jgi:competence protein ComEA
MRRMLIAGIGLMAATLPLSATGASPLSINEASAEELTEINGVGDVLAQRIVAYRKEQGGFDKLSQLTEVKGIGEQTLADMKDSIALK